jgi:hypothetical protein
MLITVEVVMSTEGICLFSYAVVLGNFYQKGLLRMGGGCFGDFCFIFLSF